MDTYLSRFNAVAAVANHMTKEMEQRIKRNFDQFQDACKPYTGKSRAQVLSIGQNKRDTLIDSIFSLKEVCSDLFSIIVDVNKEVSNDVANGIPEMLENSLKKFTDEINNSILNAFKATESSVSQKLPEDEKKHVIILESKDTDAQVYNTGSWSEVVKKKITPTLKSVPVQKTVLSKDGKGCLFFPNQKAQQEAKLALESDFNVSTATKSKKSVFPKLKIYNINNDIYTEKQELRQAILDKNSDIEALVKKGSKFDVLLFDKIKHTAIIKVSPEIRKFMVKENRVYVDMTSLRVRDHFLPMQCYACQSYGHKQGSPECKHNGSDTNVCLYCAGNHPSKTCEAKHNPELYKCNNCLTSSNPEHRANACHTSTSLCCPYTIRETNSLIRRTTGLNDEETKKFLIKQG